MAGDKVARLGQLISILCAHAGEGLASQDLAYLCGAPQRIVNADLDMLSRSFPIYSHPEELANDDEPRFWFYEDKLGKDFYPTHIFSIKETMVLLSCLEGEQDPVICQVKEKLLNSLFEEKIQPKKARCKPRLLYKGGKPPYDELQPSTLIYELAQLCCKRRLLIEYKNQRGEISKRSIDPLGLVYCWATGAWYLVSYSIHNKNLRNFRVDRIIEYKQAGTSALYETFSLQDYLADAWGVQVMEPLYEVKIRFYNDFNTYSRVYRETKERRWSRIEKESVNTLIYTDRVMGLNEFRVWIRSFGASAEVLEPNKLRKEVIDSYRRILDRYR